MRGAFFIIVLFFLTVPVIGQQPVIDSLENVLNTSTGNRGQES